MLDLHHQHFCSRLCPHDPVVHKCMAVFVEKVKVCLDDTAKALLSIVYASIVNYHDYSCTEGRKFGGMVMIIFQNNFY